MSNKNNSDRLITRALTAIVAGGVAGGLCFLYGYALLGGALVLGALAVLGLFGYEWKELHDPKAAARLTSTGPHPQYVRFMRFSAVIVAFGIAMMLAMFYYGWYLTGIFCGVAAAGVVVQMAKDGIGGKKR